MKMYLVEFLKDSGDVAFRKRELYVTLESAQKYHDYLLTQKEYHDVKLFECEVINKMEV